MRKKLFFGRVKSRILTDLQKKNSSIFLKTRKIKNSLFRKNKIVIEIGFGHGEHLVYLSKKFTKKIIIGIDPFQNGLAKVANIASKIILKIYTYFLMFLKNFIKNIKITFTMTCTFYFQIHGLKKDIKKDVYSMKIF